MPSAREIALVEGESFSDANLVAQMQAGIMAPAPIWSDLRTFPGRDFRGSVDGWVAGISCQPHSNAGKRLERADPRDLWAPFRSKFIQSGAWWFLIENVGGLLSSGGAERIWRDVYRMGGKIEAVLVTASECGLNHGRERIFILATFENRFLAHAGHAGSQGRGPFGDRSRQCSTVERSGGALADATSGRRGRETDPCEPSGEPDGSRGIVADAARERGDGARQARQARQARGIEHPDGRGNLANAHELELRRQPSTRQQPISEPDDGNRGIDVANADSSEFGSHDSISGGNGSTASRPSWASHESSRLADTLSGGRDWRPRDPQWTQEEREALEWASQGPLFAPGPSDTAAWSWITQHAPERLPAVSKHDRFRIEIGKARSVALGLAPEGSCKVWGNSPPTSWLDETGPYGLRAAIVREIAQSTLRQRSDGVDTRVDELRMLGNGCGDLQAAYAFRIAATRLARRTAPARELVRRLVT